MSDSTQLQFDSATFLSHLPKDIQELLEKASYKIYKRDAFTIAFVIDCASKTVAEALEPHKSKIYSTLAKLANVPVEGAIVFCSKGSDCPRDCSRMLGCVISRCKAFSA